MKKLLLLASFLLLFAPAVLAQNFSVTTNVNTQGDESSQTTTIEGEHIQDFKTAIDVRTDGTIHVTETIVYDFGTLNRHGIYRYIPYLKQDDAGKKYKMDIQVQSITDENGKNYSYDTTDEGNQINIKIGDPNHTITGVHTYVIKYSVGGALGYFQDHDEIYWNATGNDWTVPIASASADVSVPSTITKDQIKTSCFTGASGSTATDCIATVEDKGVHFVTNHFLNVDEGMTFVVGFPKGIVAVLKPVEVIPFWQTPAGAVTRVLLLIASFFWYIFYPGMIVVKWFRHGRDPKVQGPVSAWYDPPKNDKGRSLTAGETGSLIDEVVNQRDIVAMIVQLAQKGFMKIIVDKDKKVSLQKQKDADSTLVSFEKTFLNDIFAGEDTVELSSGEIAPDVQRAKDMLYTQLVDDGFFNENPNKIRTFYIVIGSLAMTTLNFALAVVSFIFGRNMARKTVVGAQQAMVARSLKNFLSSQERQLKFQATNQMMFEKLLPYAIAFGVEDVWAKRFEKMDIQPPSWYEGYYGGRFNTVVFVNSLNSSYSSFSSASTVPSSTGSGFSGGSSGGGGGGGGGGSW